MSSRPAARAASDYRELLADPRLDAVAIATPVATHFEFARAALEAGKHVLVEKPFTASTLHQRLALGSGDPRHIREDALAHDLNIPEASLLAAKDHVVQGAGSVKG